MEPRTATWISYDTFTRLERDWARLCAEGWRGYVRKDVVVGSVIGGFKLDERVAEAMDKNGTGTGVVGLADVMRECFPAAGKWEVRRFFVTEIPDEQLLTLKGSFGQGSTMRYLPKDSKFFNQTFDALTQSTASRISLKQLIATGETIGNMKFTIDQFVGIAIANSIDPNTYRATFWDILRVLFPRVSPQVLDRYEAHFIPRSDVTAFANCFTNSSHLDLTQIKHHIRNSPTKTLNLDNGISLDTRSFAQIDKDKDGKLSLYELVQPEKHRATGKHSPCSLSTLSEGLIEKEEDSFLASKKALPPLKMLELMYAGLGMGDRKKSKKHVRMQQSHMVSRLPPQAKDSAVAVASGKDKKARMRLVELTKQIQKDEEGQALFQPEELQTTPVHKKLPKKKKGSWVERVGRMSFFNLPEGFPASMTIHPLATKEEESVWYRHGVAQKPELRRSEKKAMNVGGSNMISTKTYKVTELLNFDNSDVYVTTNGTEVTVHCPAVSELFAESLAKPKPKKARGRGTDSSTTSNSQPAATPLKKEKKSPFEAITAMPLIKPTAPSKPKESKANSIARLKMYG